MSNDDQIDKMPGVDAGDNNNENIGNSDNIETVDEVEEVSTDDSSLSSKPYTNGGDVPRHRLQGMYQNWFLEYASYVILERAVPHIDDGLKPVQRR